MLVTCQVGTLHPFFLIFFFFFICSFPLFFSLSLIFFSHPAQTPLPLPLPLFFFFFFSSRRRPLYPKPQVWISSLVTTRLSLSSLWKLSQNRVWLGFCLLSLLLGFPNTFKIVFNVFKIKGFYLPKTLVLLFVCVFNNRPTPSQYGKVFSFLKLSVSRRGYLITYIHVVFVRT